MYFVYVITNKAKNVLYVGVTNNLSRRVSEHYFKRGCRNTFAGRYSCFNLLYFEEFSNAKSAIAREKEIKGWVRKKKNELIRKKNPEFLFLNKFLFDVWPPVELPE